MHRTNLIFFKTIKNNYASKYIQDDAGFSLVEVLVVTVMIGILAAITIPNWLGFTNRQRVGKANDAVLAALREAQREAKQKKLSYSVSFKVESNTPKFVIHPDSEQASTIQDQPNSKRWKNLGEDLGIKADQLRLLTNLSSKNTVNATNPAVNQSPTYLSNPQTIAFDYMGTLPNANFGTLPTGSGEAAGLKIVVGTPNSATKRCVIVKTILGSMLTEKDSQCN
ncbi:type II secretion system protein [Fortiea sp. LEGE XX443]|uniref:pilus assembly FimT family protein n=1 Tax=Fortiea sp. LEGE XX443 TaxID=1828611 RepID=UPI00187FF44B|nr:type II secretion system protein [Fortiea sp. LEGE XX443]MBE9004025.1 type II secretion system protein [Fortiea sp. LEGE XX443]